MLSVTLMAVVILQSTYANCARIVRGHMAMLYVMTADSRITSSVVLSEMSSPNPLWWTRRICKWHRVRPSTSLIGFLTWLRKSYHVYMEYERNRKKHLVVSHLSHYSSQRWSTLWTIWRSSMTLSHESLTHWFKNRISTLHSWQILTIGSLNSTRK